MRVPETATRADLPRVPVARWHQIAARARTEAAPVIVENAFSQSIAVQRWSPTMFAERFGDLDVDVTVDLPQHTSPYLDDHSSHGTRMTLHELVVRLGAGERCYMNQANLDRFAGLRDQLGSLALTVPPIYGVNLWVGGQTRSGLHYDSADNFLVQIYGAKSATLVAPRYAKLLRLVPDNPTKSLLSSTEIEGPDPRSFGGVPHWHGSLAPGDALYVPRGWWHYLSSPDVSISVNLWHGDRLDAKARMDAFRRAGFAVWRRTIRDFVWCGVLRRPYRQRLFSPPPLGVALYRRLTRRTRP